MAGILSGRCRWPRRIRARKPLPLPVFICYNAGINVAYIPLCGMPTQPKELPMVVSIDVEYGFSTAAVTDPGRRWRHNEDYAGYSVPKDIIERRTYGALFVVCDGDGSSMTSGLASERTVVTVLEEYYRMPADIPPEQRLEQAIQLANKAVYEDNQAHPESKEVSTTIVAAVVIANRLIVAHAGNSRAYLIRRGVCRQLTEDHAITARQDIRAAGVED